jgi:hypothetical protein
VKALQQERLAQASLVRIYATVRHFARWLHRKFPALFPLGCPTDGVKPDLVMELCCALHNLRVRLMPWQPMI